MSHALELAFLLTIQLALPEGKQSPLEDLEAAGVLPKNLFLHLCFFGPVG